MKAGAGGMVSGKRCTGRTIAAEARQTSRLSGRSTTWFRAQDSAAEALLEGFQPGKRVFARLRGRRRGEFGARLARIRVDAEEQEFGGERPEIDLAADQRLRPILIFIQNLRTVRGHCGKLRARPERHVDRLVDLVLDRLQGHHAGLADPRLDAAANVDATIRAHEIEHGGEPRDIAHVGELGERRPGLRRRLDLHMQAAVRNLFQGHRRGPWMAGIIHRNQPLTSSGAGIA